MTTTTIAVPTSCAALCTKFVELTQGIDKELAQVESGAAIDYGRPGRPRCREHEPQRRADRSAIRRVAGGVNPTASGSKRLRDKRRRKPAVWLGVTIREPHPVRVDIILILRRNPGIPPASGR